MAPILFLKAKIAGGATSDLFASPVQVKGHVTRDGTFVAPYTSTRKKHHAAPEKPANDTNPDLLATLVKPAGEPDRAASDKPDLFSVAAPREPRVPDAVRRSLELLRQGYERLGDMDQAGVLWNLLKHPTPELLDSPGKTIAALRAEFEAAIASHEAPAAAADDAPAAPEASQTAEKPESDPVQPAAPTVEKDGPTKEETIAPAAIGKPVITQFGVTAGVSKAERRKLNRAAVAILSEKTDAEMTQEDCETLAKYSGNGGCGDSLNEFYTDPEIASAMWSLLASHGFTGGDVLEPSCGTGVFMHTAPAGTRLTGVELDPISARIAGILAGPDHAIHALSFERFATQDSGLFDAVVGNPPFGVRGGFARDDKVDIDTAERYFLDTALDKTKDNGLVALVVPHGVIDSKNGRAFRERVLRKAEFLTGFRMPNTAFEASHTEVTTDVLLFRKRPQPIAGALSAVSRDVLKTLGVWNDDFLSGKYFENSGADHVFGTPDQVMRQYGPEYTVTGSMQGVAAHIAAYQPPPAEAAPAELTMGAILDAVGPDEKDQLAVQSAASKVPYAVVKLGDTKIINGVRYIWQGDPPRWHKAEVGVPDAVQAAIEIGDMLDHLESAKDTELARANLIEALDDFVRLHGLPTKNREMRAWLAAPSIPGGQGVDEAARKAARLLGAVRADGTYSDLVTGNARTMARAEIDTAAEKLALEKGGFTVDELAGETEKTPDETLDWLFANGFAVEADGQTWTSMDQYLSGDLWPRFDAATAAAAHEGLSPQYRALYERQAAALEEAIGPQTLEDIEIRINSGFITPEDITAWLDHRQDEREKVSQWGKPDRYTLSFADNVYSITSNGKAVGRLWGDEDTLLKYLNRDGLRKDDIPVVERLNLEFRDWLLGSEIRPAVEERYNRNYRGFRQREYSDAPFEIPGMSGEKKVNNYIYSGLRWALESGRGIIADDVGLGKTVQGLILARLAKATGKANKPVIVVPKSVLQNWKNEAEMWFPGSKVLTIGETETIGRDGVARSKSDSFEERRQKFHDMQQNDYDFVLISRPAWERMDVNPALKQQYVDDEFFNKRNEKLKGKKSAKAQKAEDRAKAAHDQKAAKQEFDVKDETTINFDDLGIDMMIMDEAHAYKNLFEARNRFGQTPKFLGGTTTSKTAVDTSHKSRFLREKTGGKGVYMLTATPTKNSPLEVYSMLNHIAPEAFTRMGIKNQEDFLDRYVEFKDDKILTVSGQIESALVTAGFKNLDELREVMRKYINRRTAEQVGLKLPSRDDRTNYIDMTGDQERVYQGLREQAENADGDSEGESHILSVISRMDKATLDLGLLNGKLSGPASPKLEECAKNVAELAKEGGQIVFCDSKEMHDKIARTIAGKGVPRERIGIINADEAKDSASRQKIADAFNAGLLDVVVGNTATMGEGINLQKRTTDIHHLSLPWTPSDMQQRNGRGLRQGNSREAVRIHNYLAKRSFDGYRQQTLHAKKDWQDLLWNGGDRVENLAREGAFDRTQLTIMMSDDPEKAAAELAANKEFAEKQRLITARAKAAEKFESLRDRQASLLKMKVDEKDPRWRAVRAKLETQISRLTDQLRADPDFTAKHLIDSKEPALIDKVTGNVWNKGLGFEMPPAGEGKFIFEKPTRWVVQDVADDGRYIVARPYGSTAYHRISAKADDLVNATPFEVNSEHEKQEIDKEATLKLTSEMENIRDPKDLAEFPDSALHEHHDAIQHQLRRSAAGHNMSYGDKLMFDKDGNFVPVANYDVNRVGINKPDHTFVLPTAENKAKLQKAYAEEQHSRQYTTHYDTGRNSRSVGNDGIEPQYPGASFSDKNTNKYEKHLRGLYDEEALKGGKALAETMAVAKVQAATSWPQALNEAIRGYEGSSYDRRFHGNNLPKSVFEALKAKAEALGVMDQPVSHKAADYAPHSSNMPHKFARIPRRDYEVEERTERPIWKFLDDLGHRHANKGDES